jgi:radical SAM superfamily enzyme YgiQ (UPF0313 family)
MKLTLIHPSIGRRPHQRYIRTWQMEPLPPALIAGLTPPHIDTVFYDDRMEKIPYDEPTDLVAISIETYTAKRVYQIASEYRRRNVPVVIGGFHASLCPDEVSQYAEAVVVGEAESLWQEVIDDFQHNNLKKIYKSEQRPALNTNHYDRSIFAGKRYLSLGLVEVGRGCKFKCDFCAIQTVFERSYSARPIDDVVKELLQLKSSKKFFFFVDDNFAADIGQAKEFLTAIAPLNIRWVTQMSINAAHDEEFLALLNRAGCQGVLIGFESLNKETLKSMKKGFNTMSGGYDKALGNLRRHNIRIYATFVFGYDNDDHDTFVETTEFALRHKFYIAAFNHLTPFPGTPLYNRLYNEGRLIYPSWWLDENYNYNKLPFYPKNLHPDELQLYCIEARRKFYSARNTLYRAFDKVNASNMFMFRNYFMINAMHRAEISMRNHYPLGDLGWEGPLLKAQ